MGNVLGLFVLMMVGLAPTVAHAEEGKPQPAKGAVPVRLEVAGGQAQLLRQGQPYVVRGVGGTKHFELLAQCGGNSVRTWGTDGLAAILDEAHRHGLTVAVGIWLGHERHGFDYTNADQVAAQMEKVKEAVQTFKDHPAVLVWGLGNEMEGYAAGDNAAIWSTINNLAVMVKELDPQHPTMTVVAEIGGQRVKNIHRLCPAIDIVGINSYGGSATIPERYRQAGGVKPYLLTEYGPPGIWETQANAFGAKPELTSTAKAARYRQTYEKVMQGDRELCLGSYAFLWGTKQEATATWFGMLLPDGSRLGAADELSRLWSGRPAANLCPQIASLSLEGSGDVAPQSTIRATLKASDPENDKLSVTWMLQADATELGTGGDAEAAPPTFPEAIVKSDAAGCEVRLPDNGGNYRLFVTIRDGHGGAAIGNVLIHVQGEVKIPPAPVAALPLVIYDEATREKPAFVPTGWMGNTKAMKLAEDCTDQPHAGQTCIKAEYQDTSNWGGVVWQNPPGDWGDKAGGFDIRTAKRLTFWARGAKGGEVVSFEFGLLGSGKRFADSGRGKLEKVRLTSEWKQYSIDVSGQDLSRIKTGFAWTLAADGQPVTFYLDDMQFE